MRRWNRAIAAASLVLAALAWTPAAHAGGGWHGGHGHGGHGHGHGGGHHHGGTSVVIGVSPSFGWGGPFWYGRPYAYYPYAYAYPYPYGYYPSPVVVAPPVEQPVYVERTPAPAQQSAYWYYCESEEGYYPDVETCPEPWVRVPPRSE
jgi:hypothetical protein